MTDVITWQCEECKKEIVSLYQKQMDYLKAVHLLTHKKNEVQYETQKTRSRKQHK